MKTETASYAAEIREVAAEYLTERGDLMAYQSDLIKEILLTQDSARVVELWNASRLTY